MTLDIFYYGIKLMVRGTYTKGEPQTYDYEGSSDKFEIEGVSFNGSDITELLEAFNVDVNALEQTIIDEVRTWD